MKPQKYVKQPVTVEGELPPLSAKRDNRNRWIIRSDDLEIWMERILNAPKTKQKIVKGL